MITGPANFDHFLGTYLKGVERIVPVHVSNGINVLAKLIFYTLRQLNVKITLHILNRSGIEIWKLDDFRDFV